MIVDLGYSGLQNEESLGKFDITKKNFCLSNLLSSHLLLDY